MKKYFYPCLMLLLGVTVMVACNSSSIHDGNAELSHANDNMPRSNISSDDSETTKVNLQESDSQANYLDLPVKKQLDGKYVKATLVSCNHFISDSSIPPEKKKIENYQILIRENDNKFIVSLVANRLKEEINLDGGESSLGKDVVYIINKSDYSIARRYFVE